jgi:hypothetical protein
MILFVVNGHNTNPRMGKEGSLLGHSSDSLVLDAPQWRMHWPKAVLWCGAALICLFFALLRDNQLPNIATSLRCPPG